MLFSQIERLEWQDEMISLIKVGQLWGHSCLRTEMRTRLSLLRRVLLVRKDSSVLEDWIMNWTIKLRMPSGGLATGCRVQDNGETDLGTGLWARPSIA